MIRESHGDLLRADAEALVNTVNTVGVMGKGIALQFKKAYPLMFDAYRKAAQSGDLDLGRVQVWDTGQMTGPRYIINFPTKRHWKSRSRLLDIESGLTDLIRVVRELEIKTIAVPPLGCGHGGLNWRDVEPRIRAAFAAAPDVDVLLFAPEGAPQAADMATTPDRPAMTPGRAALVELIRRYTDQALAAPGLIEAQKLMYFLQAAGEPLRLRFAANRYGPYADNLRHVLTTVEGHFLSGYGDGSAPVRGAEPLSVLPGALEDAEAALEGQPETRVRIDRVLDLAAGYESPYGLELLATVHWLATSQLNLHEDQIVTLVRSWSPRKARMFTEMHVLSALNTLRRQGWLATGSVA